MLLQLKKIQLFLKKIEKRVPYIPDFSLPLNTLKLLIFSFVLIATYTFIKANGISNYYSTLWVGIKSFSPYIVIQIIFLYFFSQKIKNARPFISILLILFITFFCIYTINSIKTQSFFTFFITIEQSIMKMLFGLGIVFFFLMYFDWKEKTNNPIDILARLKFLQSKMHPHFLFNTINSTVFLIKKDPEVAKRILLNLSAILRASLVDEQDKSYIVTLEDEVFLIHKYLEIEKIRLGSRLAVNIEIDESLKKTLVPKLFLQPLVENSILHGIQHISNGGVVNLFIKKNNERVLIEIGNPISPSNIQSIAKNQHNGISLKNIKERLDLLFDYDVVFESLVTGSTFIIKISFPICYHSRAAWEII